MRVGFSSFPVPTGFGKTADRALLRDTLIIQKDERHVKFKLFITIFRLLIEQNAPPHRAETDAPPRY